jgi:hypothetical protein
MYHGRVKYPQQERADKERAERLHQQEKILTGHNGKDSGHMPSPDAHRDPLKPAIDIDGLEEEDNAPPPTKPGHVPTE